MPEAVATLNEHARRRARRGRRRGGGAHDRRAARRRRRRRDAARRGRGVGAGGRGGRGPRRSRSPPTRSARAATSRLATPGTRRWRERWVERHERYVPADDEEGLGALAGRAARHDMAGEWEEAAAAYRTIVEASDLEAGDVQQLALREGQLRLVLGEHDRAVEALADAAAARRGALPHGRDRRRRVRRAGAPRRDRRRAGGGAGPAGRLGRRAARAATAPAACAGATARRCARTRPAASCSRSSASSTPPPAALRWTVPSPPAPSCWSATGRCARGSTPSGSPARRWPTSARCSSAGEAVATVGLHFTGTVAHRRRAGRRRAAGRPAAARGRRHAPVARAVRRRADDGDSDWLMALNEPGLRARARAGALARARRRRRDRRALAARAARRARPAPPDDDPGHACST